MPKTITTCFVEFIPDVLKEGILYISEKYHTTTHLCPCGCGEKVPIPIDPNFWDNAWILTVNGDKPTLMPSLLQRFACKSHYFITAGKIVIV